jgi:hypothetical protein
MAKTVVISVRLQDDLAAWIKANAEKETRSVNGEIIHQLKIAKAAAESKPSPR